MSTDEGEISSPTIKLFSSGSSTRRPFATRSLASPIARPDSIPICSARCGPTTQNSSSDMLLTVRAPPALTTLLPCYGGCERGGTFSSSSRCRASSTSTVTRQPRVPSVTRLRAGLAKPTTGITVSPSIGCGARVTGGCSQADPSNICGSTPPRSRATHSRCFPRWLRVRHNPVGRQVSTAN